MGICMGELYYALRTHSFYPMGEVGEESPVVTYNKMMRFDIVSG